MNHKRISIFGTIFILVMLVLLASSVPAAAQAEKIYFSGEDCPIYMGPPEKQWVSDDGVLHMRGSQLIATLTDETSYLDGLNYGLVNQDIDLATGVGHVYGSVEIHPDIGGGTWVGHFSTHISPEGVEGKAIVHGTGDFEGMTTFNNISSPVAPNPACFNMNTASNGYILVP